MDYIIENALIVTEKRKDSTDVLKVYADRITAFQRKEKEEKKHA